MGSSSERSSAPESQLLSRRTLVRAGATAAWTVPAIQLVGAAPAFAGSVDQTTITLSPPTGNYATSTRLRVKATVTNNGPHTTKNLRLTVVLPLAAQGTVTAAGWQVQGADTDTYVFVSNGPVAVNTSASLDVTFAVPMNPPGNLTVNADADNSNAPHDSKTVPVDGAAQNTTLQWASTIAGSYVAMDASKLTVTTNVKNAGAAPASDIKIKVTLASALSATSATVPGNSWTVAGSGTVWTFSRSAALPYNTSDGFTATFSGLTGRTGGAITGFASASNAGTGVTSGGSVDPGASILAVSAVSGTYSSTDASQITMKGTVSNSGNLDATGLSATFNIPPSAGYDRAPSASQPTGWSPADVTGSTGAGWSIKFTRAAQLAASNGTDTVTTVVTTAGSTAGIKYAGASFTETFSATATNANGVPPSATATVPNASAPTVALYKGTADTTYVPPVPDSSNTGQKSYTLDFRVHNNGPKAVKDVLVTINVTKTTTAPSSLNASWTLQSNTQGNGSKDTVLVFKYAGPLEPGSTTVPANAMFQTQGNAAISVTGTTFTVA